MSIIASNLLRQLINTPAKDIQENISIYYFLSTHLFQCYRRKQILYIKTFFCISFIYNIQFNLLLTQHHILFVGDGDSISFINQLNLYLGLINE